MKKIEYIKKNLLLFFILIIAALLRFYRIRDYMIFLGDEGRDVLVVKSILEGHLAGIGPTASVGGFFSGPFYYYLMAPFLFLWQYDPVGPAIMVALFSIFTVLVIYFVGKTFFNQQTGLFAAFFYSISPLVITYARSSWNPNPMPLFTLVTALVVYKAVNARYLKYFFLAGILYGCTLQLHYIEVFFGIAIFLYILLYGYKNPKALFFSYISLLLGIVTTFIPFIGFEIKHGYPNTIALSKFISGSTGDTGFHATTFIFNIGNVLFRVFGRLIVDFPTSNTYNLFLQKQPVILSVWSIGVILLICSSLFFFFKNFYSSSDPERKRWYTLMTMWLGTGILLFGFYKKPIYDYYFEFLFPLPFLLTGFLLSSLWKRKYKVFAIIIFLILLGIDLYDSPLKPVPNRQLNQMQTISQFVADKADKKPFNFALITGSNSDHAYRYFFTLWKNEPITIQNAQVDPKRISVTDQLLVICESVPCAPVGNPLWEIAGFGRAKIADHWNISVVEVYKLVHTESK